MQNRTKGEYSLTGVIEGFLEESNDDVVKGWCWMPAFPYVALEVVLQRNDVVLEKKLAYRYRHDLELASKRLGCCSFIFDLNEHFTPTEMKCKSSVFSSLTVFVVGPFQKQKLEFAC